MSKDPNAAKQTSDDKMLALLTKWAEEGTAPWQSNIVRQTMEIMPKSGISGKVYQGINYYHCGYNIIRMGWDSNEFITFFECKKREGSIKKGEKGTMIFQPMAKCYLKSTGDRITEAEYAERVKSGDKDARKVVFYNAATVFNLAQTTLEYEKFVPQKPESIIDSRVDGLLEEWIDAPNLRYNDFLKSPCYYPALDEIEILTHPNFTGLAYDEALAHEMCHATGHKSRLNRDMGGGGKSERYAKEELIAEIGSNLVLARLGYADEELGATVQNSGAYLRSWAKHIKDTGEVKGLASKIMTAFSSAQKAADYIFDRLEEDEE